MEIARAVLEAQVFQVRAMTDAFGAAGFSVSELRADGGAAAMDSLICMQATLSHTRVRRSSSLEATARGVALAAGLGCGLWTSIDELESLWTSTFDALSTAETSLETNYQSWITATSKA